MANTHYVISGLQNNAKSIRYLAKAASKEILDNKSGPDRFTFRESLAHLADWEPILRSRIVLCAQDSGGIMKAFDEGEMAMQNNYSESNPMETVEVFYQERLQTCLVLASFNDENWNGVALHPERGPMSAYEWTASLLGHDAYHIEDFLSITHNSQLSPNSLT